MTKSKYLSFIGYLLLVTACSTSNVKFDPSKAHHGDGKFISIKEGSFFEWLKMRWREDSPAPVDREAIKEYVVEVDRDLIESQSDLPRATWIGHATVLVQYRGINFLTDPHLTQRPFAFDFLLDKRFTQPALTFEQMPKIDFVVISHNHFDHLDHRTVDMYGNSVTWFVPLGLKAWFLDRDINSENVVELDWWDEYRFSDQVSITFTPNQHWSKRSPWDTNESLWGSWAIDIAGFKSWFAGDTGYNQRLFKEIGERLGPFRMAMIPIGAYAPRYFMAASHVDPAEAVSIHQDIKSQQSMPIHWGTFQLTHEPTMEPPELLTQSLKTQGIEQQDFAIVKIGQTLIFD